MSYKDQPEEIPVPVRYGRALTILSLIGIALTVVAIFADAGRVASGFLALYWLFVCGVSIDSLVNPKP